MSAIGAAPTDAALSYAVPSPGGPELRPSPTPAADPSKAPPTVSVIVPCRNEKDHIGPFVQSLLSQERDDLEIEVLIADGMSDDGTRDVLHQLTAGRRDIRVIDNPGRIVSTGLNAAIRAATGEIILRMDVHTEYASDYVRQCVATLLETGADNVGGAARTRTRTYLQKAISLAYHSPFSVGGARFHDPDYQGYVDTVTYGCWMKATLERLGLFDEELVRNQDDELNLRLIRAGGKIWQSRAIQSWYYPRSSLRALFRQYAQYGYWKVRVIQKHRLPASIRHLVPGAFVGLLILLPPAALFKPRVWKPFKALLLLYGAADTGASLLTCRGLRLMWYLPVMPLVFAAYHFGYGYGFLRGVLDFLVLRKSGVAGFSTITRGRSR